MKNIFFAFLSIIMFSSCNNSLGPESKNWTVNPGELQLSINPAPNDISHLVGPSLKSPEGYIFSGTEINLSISDPSIVTFSNRTWDPHKPGKVTIFITTRYVVSGHETGSGKMTITVVE